MNAQKDFDTLRIPSRNRFWAGSSVTEDLLMTGSEDLNHPHVPAFNQFSKGYQMNSLCTSHGNDLNSHTFPPTTWSTGEQSPNSSCRFVDNPFAIGMPWGKVDRSSSFLPTESTNESQSSHSSASSSSPIISGFQDMSLSSYSQEEDLPDLGNEWTPSESEASPPPEYVNLMRAYQEWMRYKQRNSSYSVRLPTLPKPFQSQEDKGCVLCKKNCKPKSFYSTHVLKDNNGVVICPVLREFTCPRCGATGDRAHTLRFCPIARKENHI